MNTDRSFNFHAGFIFRTLLFLFMIVVFGIFLTWYFLRQFLSGEPTVFNYMMLTFFIVVCASFVYFGREHVKSTAYKIDTTSTELKYKTLLGVRTINLDSLVNVKIGKNVLYIRHNAGIIYVPDTSDDFLKQLGIIRPNLDIKYHWPFGAYKPK